jgi:uncharacterized repeat protein (TIGR01451 family)
MLGPAYNGTYNALGYNPTNNYLYAMVLGANNLLQIDSNGNVTPLGAVTGFPTASNTPSNGAFDGSGNYWVTGGNGSTKAYQINVLSTPPAVISTLTLSQAWQPIDFSLSLGFMWGLSGTTVYRLDLSSGTVTTFPAPSGVTSGNFGAAWTFSNGNLGFSNNGTGDIYQISVTSPSGTPTFGLVSHYTGPVAGSSNDGAACVAPLTTDLAITKTGSIQVAPNGTISWTLTVTNNGPGNSSGYAVNDTIPAGVTGVTASSSGCATTGNPVKCSEGALASGSTFVITLTGKAPSTFGTCFTNTATVTSNEVDPTPGNNTASLQTCTSPAITLVKSASITGFSSAGTPVTYSYKVTNPATSAGQNLTSVTVTDPMPGLSSPISCPVTTLAPGASTTCTATYTTTQGDVDRGSINNTGTATGTPPTGPNVTATSSVTIPGTQSPAISLVKSASITGFSAPGTPVTYSYVVKNTGNVTLSSVGVTDPMTGLSAISCPSRTLAPGVSTTCSATYTTTQADVDRGSITNTGTASGTPPTGPAVTAPSTTTIPGTRTPGISLVKSASITSFSAPGTAVTFSYLVKNTGNVTLTSVGVSDPLSGLSSVTCPSSTLAPGASQTCTAHYTTTQVDVDAGSLHNTGTASGTPPTGPAVTVAQSVTIPGVQNPAIALVKSSSTGSFSGRSTGITYSYKVTNTGNVTLHSVGVTDPMQGLSAVTCPSSTLAPGATETCTATYTTTQADVDRGSITNTGTASGTPPTGSPVTAPSTVVIPLSQTPSIDLEKTASITSFSSAGTHVTYSYQVTNTGNVTLHAVGVSDPMTGLSAINCGGVTTLAPAASVTCTATYTTTQADVDRGSVNNTGTASGTPPTGTAVTHQSSATIPAVTSPAITLLKSASITSFTAAGTLITYSYKVTNTGNVTLHSVGVTDPMTGLSAISCGGVTTLAPLASVTCTATYTTNQADVDRGSVANTGTASGTPPTGAAITAPSSLNIPSVRSPAIGLVKMASPASFSAPGVVISYSYKVTNTGNVTLTSVHVTDPMSGLSAISCGGVTTLAPAASVTCTATYTTTQADVDRGSVANTGTATGTPPSGPPVTAQSPATVPANLNPAIGLVKTASPTTISAAGAVISYSYKVTNTGNVTLHSVGVTDPLPGLSAVSCGSTTLVPAASETCTATYTATQADVDRGSVANTGTATGTPPSGPAVTHQSSVTVTAGQSPAIAITKSADITSFAAAGTLITYSYKVTNTGNVTLHSVGVSDPMTGLSAINCGGVTTLAPGAFVTCIAMYTTTQADVDRATLTNTGTTTGTSPSGTNVTASSTQILQAVLTPAIGIRKTASITSFSAAGVPVTYTYLLTNTGNVTLHAVGVTDPLPGLSTVTCPSATLDIGASETCTATYTTTQADVDRGSVPNTGTATGTSPTGLPVTATASVTVPAVQTAKIALVKTADTPSFAAAGTVITYHYQATNTGNVSLNPVVVTDPMAGLSAINCDGVTSLAPGAFVTCTATYTTTQADVDRGSITNTGTATGTPPTGPAVKAEDSATVPAIHNAAIGVVKSASITSFSKPGEAVTYSYLVSNVGNETLTAVKVTDPMPGLSSPITCPTTTLAPGAEETCTATYTTTQEDVDAGKITNTGTAVGTPPSGPNVTNTSTLTVPATQTPAISLEKTSTLASFSAPGEEITYRYLISNTGNVTLNPVTATDPMTGLSPITCPLPTLLPGAEETCTATYTTTQADVDRGSITNTGTATGRPPSGPAVTAISTVIVPAVDRAAIDLLKEPSPSTFTAPGTVVTYSYTVTNSGNVTLHAVGVTDPMVGLSAVACPATTLAPGATEVCTATYTTTQADVDRGKIVNTGVASGTSPLGAPVTDSANATVTAVQTAAIFLVKSPSVGSFSAAATAITYTYLVTNTGNVTLTSVGVTDPMPGLSAIDCHGVTTLAPGASQACTATYSTTQANVNAGKIVNTGTASGTPPSGPPVTHQSTVTVIAVQTPAIGLVKSANVVNFSGPNVLVTYSYFVTNNGNVTLASVGVTDPMPNLSVVTCTTTTLVPAASEICTATYTTTQADVDRGSITNTGTAFGTPPTGPVVTHQSTVTVPAALTPAVTFVKSANPGGFSTVGSLITYSYLVTNTGNVTLNPVVVTDPLAGLSAIDCQGVTALAPAASVTCTATYHTTQVDLDVGKIINTATLTATPPSGPPLTRQSSATVLASQRPAILLAKSPSITTFSTAGTDVTYSYQVTNTGNVTLTAVTVTDPMPGLSAISCPAPTLAPGTSQTCAATYTTTQANVDAGAINNTAVASGTPPNGLPKPTSTASATVQALQTPGVTLVKKASIDTFSATGTPVTYTYLVTNSGNVTLTSVGVSDPLAGLSVVSCPTSTLAPGQSQTCTATYATTQADVDRGAVSNTGTATGTPPSGPPVTATSTVTIPASQAPAIDLVKSADVKSFFSAGTSIVYSYRVTNTGNVTLTSVGVTDPLPGLSSVTCPFATLAPRESETCTATYTVTQADVDSGSIINTGTAAGTPPAGAPVTAQSSVTVPLAQTPAIGIAKSGSVTTFSAPGVPITYTYMVTNSGNVTLHSVSVTDPLTGLSAVVCPVAPLAPGNSETCTATYTTTQADVDHGGVTNTGTASGATPTGAIVSDQATLTIPSTSEPGIRLVKSTNTATFSGPGEVVTYHYQVSNTGNVTLTSVHVDDPLPGLSPISCPSTTLAPAADETCTATYTTTQADVDAGDVTNTATAAGTPPSGPPPTTAPSTVTIPATQTPAIGLQKSASISRYSVPGTPVTYQFLVSNTGNVTLTSVHVDDPLPGLSPISCADTTLAPGGVETCTATYTTAQADVDRGSVTNTGTAAGTPPSGPPVTDQSTATIPGTQSPVISLDKSASILSFSSAGTPITYSYLVTNAGNVTLDPVTVTDPLAGLSAISCPDLALLPAGSETCSSTYTTTQADVDRGSVANTGTATGTPPSGPDVTATSTVTVPAAQTPAIGLVKSASINSFSAAGTPVTYRYEVTNSGNVTLTAITVTDPKPGLSAVDCNGVTTLAPGASESCTATYATTQDDLNAGSISNTGTAAGTPPIGPVVTHQSSVTILAEQQPAIGMTKSATPMSFTTPGVVLTYDYLVTNSGNVTLHAITVTDPQPGLSTVTCPADMLVPGALETCTATYTTTQADVDAGEITNTGTAAGTGPEGQVVDDQSFVTVAAPPGPEITLTKSSDPKSFSAPGVVIHYQYLVKNTGNVTLSPVTIVDPMPNLSLIDCHGVASLGPNQTVTCDATYTTTQADVDAGEITNTGKATGDPPNGTPVSDPSTVTVGAIANPAITLAKSASLADFETPGQVVTYSYLVTNTGNVTVSQLSVTDPMVGLSMIVCPSVTSLAPGASMTCTATYTTTDDDVKLGRITNTGTARAASPAGVPEVASSTDVVPEARIAVVKSASVPSFSAPGVAITYKYLVTNTGNISLSTVGVTDPMPGLSEVTCPAPTLAPGASETCTATYKTTQADVDRGGVTNTGTAAGTPRTPPIVTATSTVTVPSTRTPSMSLAKSASIAAFTTAGTKVTYSYLVTNTGNVTISGVKVVDPMPGLSTIVCPSTTLAPAASETCTATYTTTQADVTRGSVVNAAVASGTDPAGAVTSSGTSKVIIPDDAPPSVLPPTAGESPITPETLPVTG